VLENWPWERREAVVLQEDGIVVLEANGSRALRYVDVLDLAQLVKEPVPDVLKVQLVAGGIFEVPIRQRDGQIVDFMRFLRAASHEARARAQQGAK
jgi:hypothetical protein